MVVSIYCWLLVLYSIATSETYKILVLSPSLSHSHIHFQGAIADVLVDAGHEVHIFIPEYDVNEITNGSTKAHRVTRYNSTFETLFKDLSFKKDVFSDEGAGFAFDFQGWDYFRNTSVQYCHDMVNDARLMDELRQQQYDVALAEGYSYCYFGIFHALKIRTKIVTMAIAMTENLADTWGIPSPKSYVVNSLNGLPDAPNLNFRDRFINILAYYTSIWYGFEPTERLENQILKQKFGSDFPNLQEIVRNVSLALFNSIDFLDISRPISKKMVYIGGLNVAAPNKELKPKIGKVFETAQKGVVLFSFGAITDTRYMSGSMKMAFLRAFARFPDYNFLWKSNFSDAQTIMSDYPNVHVVEWMDQTTILAHPKTRAFITHCGLNSITESVHSGIPMLAIPLFGDQNYNAAIVRHRSLGVYVNIKDVSEERIYASLEELLNTDRYRKNAQKFKRMLAKRPNKPREEVRKWVEFAAEFPDLTMMNLHGAELNFVTYHCLDVFAAAIVVASLTLIVVIRASKLLLKKLMIRKTKIE